MKVLIIEDENLAANNLKKILHEIGDLEIMACLESISETIEWFGSNRQPDLVFMDIQLGDGSAFEIFDQLQIHCPIVFTTAYNEYAINAFKVNSIDYLLKPIEISDVRQALKKLSQLTQHHDVQDEIITLISKFKKDKLYCKHFLVSAKGDKLIPLNYKEIACIYVDAGRIKVKTLNNNIYIMDNTLDELGNMLNPRYFFRANRQFIISRNAIKDIDFWFNNRLSLNLKVDIDNRILISKVRVSDFKNWFASQ